MDNYRKTLAFKICGFSFFVLVLLVIIFAIFTNCILSGAMHDFIPLFITIGVFSVTPKIALALFTILSIIAFITKNKFANMEHNIIADIGYIIMFIISVFYIIVLLIMDVLI